MKRAVPIAIVALLFASAGCEQDKGTLPENSAPRTYLSIIGADLDTTDYRKALHWWGTDPDGRVDGYLIRWSGTWQPVPGTERVYEGTTYGFTTATQDTFPVPLDGTFGEPTFTVRAVDDQGLVDPTGVTQRFPLSNHAPSISWNPALTRPNVSLPAVAFGFNVRDFDGRDTVRDYKIWLDGDSAAARVVTDTTFALWPDDFDGRINRERTLSIQAFDEANAPSNILTHTWNVQAPAGDWLLIDQITGPGTADWDIPFYHAVLDSVTGGSLHTINLVNGPDFATEVEFAPLFSLFRGVAWLTGPYRDSNDRKMARNLAKAEKALRTYVAGGGRVLIVGQTVIGTSAGLSDLFADDVLGIASFYERRLMPESRLVTDLPLSLGYGVLFNEADPADTLRVYTTATNVDYFPHPHPPGRPSYWVRPGALRAMLSPDQPIPEQDAESAYLGILSEYGDGRIGVVAASYARLFNYRNEPQRIREAVRYFREVLGP